MRGNDLLRLQLFQAVCVSSIISSIKAGRQEAEALLLEEATRYSCQLANLSDLSELLLLPSVMLDSKRELSVGRAGIRIRPGTRGLASCLYVTTFGYYSRKPLKSQFNETLSPDWILLTDCCRVGSKLVVVSMPKKDYFS